MHEDGRSGVEEGSGEGRRGLFAFLLSYCSPICIGEDVGGDDFDKEAPREDDEGGKDDSNPFL